MHPRPSASAEPASNLRTGSSVIARKEVVMLLLIVLAVLAIVAFGVGFTIHWLFIVAAVLALIWVISLLTGGIGGRRRTGL
jgi:hypothetical protein